jgi:hypothetical protein
LDRMCPKNIMLESIYKCQDNFNRNNSNNSDIII